MSIQTKVQETLIKLLEQKAVPNTEQIKQAIVQNPNLMLSDILDSVDKVEFCLLLEDAFHISVPDQEQDQLDTFAQVVLYVDNAVCQ